MDSSKLNRAKLLFKLARRRNWGASHTALDNLKKGFKPHEQGEANELVKALIKDGWLLIKPAHYGTQISLNVKFSEEIKAYIRNVLKAFIE